MTPLDGSQPARPALCVVNYNGARYLPSTLERVRSMSSQFSKIVLVDDASTDDSVALARELLPSATVVARSQNGGPGAARNSGLERIGVDRIVFMDNDVELETNAVARLAAALDAHPRAVIAMPRIVSRESPACVEYEGGEAHFSGLLTLRRAGAQVEATGTETARVGSLISCCFMFDRSRWPGGLLFDDSFHIYLEDHELGVRARMLGLELLAVPEALGFHGTGTPGISIRATGAYTSARVVGTMVHRWMLLLKLYETRTLVLLAPYLIVFEVLQFGGAVVLGWGRHWLAAVRRLISSLPPLLRSRAAFRRARRIADKAVLSGGPHPFNPALRKRRSVRVALGLLDSFAALNWAVARRFMAGATSG